MRRCAIWYRLYNLKNVKRTHRGVLLLVSSRLKPATLLKVTFLRWCFSRFLKNCTNRTTSPKTSLIIKTPEWRFYCKTWTHLQDTRIVFSVSDFELEFGYHFFQQPLGCPRRTLGSLRWDSQSSRCESLCCSYSLRIPSSRYRAQNLWFVLSLTQSFVSPRSMKWVPLPGTSGNLIVKS